MSGAARPVRTERGENPYESPVFLDGALGTIRPGGFALTGELVESCGIPRGARILDVGCGMGATAAFLRDTYGFDACGVDTSSLLLKRGRERHPGTPLYNADAMELPFEAESFDGVLAECSLQATGRPGDVLREANRVLKEGGFLLVSDPYARSRAAEASRRERPSRGCLACLLTREELCEAAAAAGFAILRWEDRSEALRGYLAAAMMRDVDCSPLASFLEARPGYCIMAARKASRLYKEQRQNE